MLSKCCQENQQSLAADVSYAGCENEKKFGTLIDLALLHIVSKISELWPKQSPLGRQNSQVGKNL